jgi:flagellar biosynthesis chaperone FliJ
MAPHDDNDFIDREYQQSQQMSLTDMAEAPQDGPIKRIPAREQLEAKVGTTQQRLIALKQEQEKLEKERVALEDLRRRRAEFTQGREEMLSNLSKGIATLEEEEEKGRRQIEDMGKSLLEFREHLQKVEKLSEDAWEEDNLNRELTRALITIENARKEWISAVPKFPVLNPKTAPTSAPVPHSIPEPKIKTTPKPKSPSTLQSLLASLDFDQFSWKQWAQIGLALTWPVALVLLVGVFMLVAVWLQGGS